MFMYKNKLYIYGIRFLSFFVLILSGVIFVESNID